MAGKFLTLEETARRLGISVDEVNRLVDRKELFPMRAGTSIKFKVEDVERAAADLGSAAAPSGGDGDLDLELELSDPMLNVSGALGGDDLQMGSITAETDSIFSDAEDAAEGSASHTVVRGGGSPAASGTGAFDVDDLGLESVIGASSPSLGGSLATPDPIGGGESGTLEIDLPGASGSLAGGSLAGVSGLSGPTSAASGVIDSGLSLEGPGAGVSGIDLDTSLAGGASLAVSGGSLVGGLDDEGFQLGVDPDDEESASVVIATEETGDSSFFAAAGGDDSASVSLDGSSGSSDLAGGSMLGMDDALLRTPAAQLTVWQVVGLVCCTLLLSIVLLLAFDVLQTVRAPQGSPVSGPILNALTKTFGW